MSLRVIRRRVWGLMGRICMDHRRFHQFHPQKQGLVRSLKWVWVKSRQRSATWPKPGPLRVLGLRSLDPTIWGESIAGRKFLVKQCEVLVKSNKASCSCSSYRLCDSLRCPHGRELCPFSLPWFSPKLSQNCPKKLSQTSIKKWGEISQPWLPRGTAQEPSSWHLSLDPNLQLWSRWGHNIQSRGFSIRGQSHVVSMAVSTYLKLLYMIIHIIHIKSPFLFWLYHLISACEAWKNFWSAVAGTLLHWLCWELQSWTGTTGSSLLQSFLSSWHRLVDFKHHHHPLTAGVPRWPAFPASCGKELFAWTGSGTKRADPPEFREKTSMNDFMGWINVFDDVSITESQQDFKAWGSTNEWHVWKWVGLVGNIPATMAIDGEHFIAFLWFKSMTWNGGTGFLDTFLIHKTILKWKTHTTETRVSTFFWLQCLVASQVSEWNCAFTASQIGMYASFLSVPGVCSSLSRCSRAWWAFCQDGRLQHGHCYKSLISFIWTTHSKNKEQTQQKKGTTRKQSNRRQIEGKGKRTWKDLNLQTFVLKVCKTSKTTPHP